MSTAIPFPSTQWFQALAENMRTERASFEPLGSIDCTVVIKINDPEMQALFEVKFRSYEVESIRHLTSVNDAAADHFSIEATLDTWREMIDNIKHNGVPDLEHTLNYLTFPDDPMRVDGPDQLHIDTFFRFNQSLQLFFNGVAGIATRYPS